MLFLQTESFCFVYISRINHCDQIFLINLRSKKNYVDLGWTMWRSWFCNFCCPGLDFELFGGQLWFFGHVSQIWGKSSVFPQPHQFYFALSVLLGHLSFFLTFPRQCVFSKGTFSWCVFLELFFLWFFPTFSVLSCIFPKFIFSQCMCPRYRVPQKKSTINNDNNNNNHNDNNDCKN